MNISNQSYITMLSMVAGQNDLALLICSPDLSRIYYVNQTFCRVLGLSQSQVIHSPNIWRNSIISENNTSLSLQNNYDACLIERYKIKLENSQQKYIVQNSHLISLENRKIKICLIRVVDRVQWHSESGISASFSRMISEKDSIISAINDATIQESKLKSTKNNSVLLKNGINVELTKRQYSCLQQFLLGKSIKEVARVLSLSYRTVEIHSRNIKTKFNCRRISEVYFRIDNNEVDKIVSY